jgi:SAM-dependent methyltransferase
MEAKQHWEGVYQAKADAELSWFQARPGVGLSLVEGLDPRPRSAIDVGGGQSALAGELLDAGVESVTVLDISAAALERARARLGPRAGAVRWVVADVLDDVDLGAVDLWHDRAVFHFLTDAADRRRYVEAAARAVRAGGHAVISTFAPSGPERCSGLPVCRYDAGALAAEFSPWFELVRSEGERHTTPWGKTQDFTWVVLRRRATGGGSV